MSRVAFYARVSTMEQSLDQQRDALAAARITPDCEFAEKLSGSAAPSGHSSPRRSTGYSTAATAESWSSPRSTGSAAAQPRSRPPSRS